MSSTSDVVSKDRYLFSLDRLFPENPFVVVEGEGAVVRDLEGREYIDLLGGFGVSILGHSHPKVVEAVRRQAGRLGYMSTLIHTELLGRLAERLAEVSPEGITRSFFCNSGSEAVDIAVLIARRFKNRPDIIALWGGYHGRTMLSVSATGIGVSWKFKTREHPLAAGITHAPYYYCYRCPFGLEYPECNLLCAEIVENVIQYQTSGEVAAFIAEPIQGVAGVIPAPPEYFRRVKKILDEYDVCLIMDEVGTAFGRTGRTFAVEHYGVKPDMIVGGKALTAGFSSLNAVMTTDEASEAITPEERYYLTYGGGNLIGCAAALAYLEVMEEERVCERAERLGEYFMKGLRELQEKYELIGDVRGKGLMIGVELVRDEKTKEPLTFEECYGITLGALERGVILPAGFGLHHNEIRIYPPVTITEEQVDRCVGVIEECVREVSRSVGK